jgi:hypothetical protein
MTVFQRFAGRALTAVIAILLMIGSAQAQNVMASISGTVMDSTGAVVSGATVTAVNTDRSETLRMVTTDASGFYSLRSMPLGNYQLTISAHGFSDLVLQGIVLHVDDSLTVNASLHIGTEKQEVEVTTASQTLNFENATQAGLINGTQVRELVLSSRNYEQLVGLQPGVAYSGADQIYIGNSSPNGATNVVNFAVNGSRTSGNAWTVDGSDNVDRGSNFTLLTYPSVDAIAEFKTLRGTYEAEFGRSASGQINVVTKSGSNSFHGSAYEFVRNDIFNANDVLNKLTTTPSGAAKATAARGLLRYNDFGYTIGGPVWIPKIYDGREHKTYFFFSQEIRRVITYKPLTLTGVPSLQERQGIFNVAVCNSTTAGKCNNAGVTTVPITSTMAQGYLKDIYANVAAPDSTGTLVTQPLRNLFNGNQQIVRVDQQIGQKLGVFFRFINDSIPTQEPSGLFTNSPGYPGVNTTNTNAPGRIYLGHITYVVSPSLLIDGGYAYSHGALLSDPVGSMLNANSPDIKPTLLFPSTLPRVPALTFSSGTGLTTYGPYRDYNRNHNVFANVTKTVRTHTLKFGVDYNHYNKQENNASANAGSFAFTNGNLPTGSKAQAYQQAWANFLTGFVTTFTQASIDVTPSIIAQQFELYVQDDWKVTPRLTLNIGVRYSHFAQPIDGNNQLTTFDPSLYNASQAPTVDTSGLICVTGAPCSGVKPNGSVTLSQAITNGVSINNSNSPYGSKVGKADNLNFAPRLGFALDVFGNGMTSLRGGYGIAFDSSLFGTYEQNIFQNPPFVNTPTVSNTSFDNPGAVSANVNYAAQVIRATSPHFRTPYNQQFSLNVQQQLPGRIVAEIGYVGSVQDHLLGLVDINQAPVGAYAAANPGTAVTSGNVSLINPYRPYKGFSAINSVQPIFMGNYNSLQASARKEWAHNSLVAANYTWSHSLTNANADRSGAPQISTIPSAEYGPSAADRHQMFNFNAVWGLPFFYEQHGLVGHLLGGWEVSGLGYFNSGLPLNVTTSGLDPAGVGVVLTSSVSGGRPDRIDDPNHTTTNSGPIHNRLHWFNINAFTAVPSNQIRGGNAQRNVVQGPGWWRVDTGLFKNVNITEAIHLQFRGEAFNLFNHTNPDTISSTSLISASGFSSTAGNITGYRDKRILQLGAKLVF